MKVLAIVFLCAFAAVQGRSAVVSKNSTLAVQGENPWLVHLRIAVSTSGLLNTGAGSLIASNWILTAADNVKTARFIWARYGAINVINPSLVTESSTVRIHESANIALISIGRVVHTAHNIAHIPVVGGLLADSYNFCAFGVGKNEGPGEYLKCFEIFVEQESDKGLLVASSEEGAASQFDLGAPLVNDGVQVALLVAADDSNAGSFLQIAEFVPWIESVLSPETEGSSSSSSSSSSESEEEDTKVKFVN